MKDIIEKWYWRLNFPKKYDNQFLASLSELEAVEPVEIEEYVPDSQDLSKNLLFHLYYCEKLSQKYAENNIPEDILYSTLSDIVIWTKVCFSITGIVGLRCSRWLINHLSFRLFRLGRLQFCLGSFKKAYSRIGVASGEAMIEVHIAEGESLLDYECDKSFVLADKFFEKYFPEHKYRFYTCHSWLLDKENRAIIKEGSNIWKFANRFAELEREKSDAILKYVFRYDATRETLSHFEATTSLSQAVKNAALRGEPFYEVFGYIMRKNKQIKK